MPLDDIRAQVAKLTPKPGDLITLTLSRQITRDEIDTVRDMLFRILPAGCKVAILPPGTTLTATPQGTD